MAKAPLVAYACGTPSFGRADIQGPSFNVVPLLPWSDNSPPSDSEKQGFRNRWIVETAANRNSYRAANNIDCAPIAEFNPRASMIYRNPWDNSRNNVAGTDGYYTCSNLLRDYASPEAGWISPPVDGGRTVGNPFGRIGEAKARRYVLFDLPESTSKILSLAAFRHARLSEYVWHPAYAVGESLMSETSPSDATAALCNRGVWNSMLAGDGICSDAVQNITDTQQIVYDQSYELNATLYDRFFLSGATDAAKTAFVKDPVRNPLPNPRLVPVDVSTRATSAAKLDFHRAASALMLAGGFNVNSTDVDAWTALLASMRDLPSGKYQNRAATAFPRVAEPLEGPGAGDRTSREANAGYRNLSDAQIRTLAARLVEEVRLRGPFLSLADFVNRRLESGYVRPTVGSGSVPASFSGALQAAIDRAGLNKALTSGDCIMPDATSPWNTRGRPLQKPLSKAAGLPGYLSQGDILQSVDPVLTARSDTFRVRACGESSGGAVVYLEAVVQRFPEPVRPDAGGLEPDLKNGRDFGRRFRILAIRQLSSDEV